MQRIARPLDKKRNWLDSACTEAVHHAEPFPPQGFSQWSPAGTIGWSKKLVTGFAGRCGDGFNIIGSGSPIDETRFGQLSDIDVGIVSGLRRIGCDDLEI